MYTYLLLVCCMHLLFKGKNHVLEAVELFLFLWDNVSWTLHVLKTKIKPSKLIEFFKSIVCAPYLKCGRFQESATAVLWLYKLLYRVKYVMKE